MAGVPGQTALYPQLPDDIPKAVWSTWPRKAEAHAVVGVRQRQVTMRVASGALPCYGCPDDSVRIPIDLLKAQFDMSNPAKPVAQSDRSAAYTREHFAREQIANLTNKDLDLDDPVVGMFRECRIMLKEEREHSRAMMLLERDHSRAQLEQRDKTNQEQLKLLVGPVQTVTTTLQSLCADLQTRVKFLEERQDTVINERELMADFRHARDVEIEQMRAREQRRNEVMSLLKRELGPVLISKLGGDSLSSFVSNVRPELVELLLQSQLLAPEQEKRLRGIVEGQRAKQATESQATGPAGPTNGATSAHTGAES